MRQWTVRFVHCLAIAVAASVGVGKAGGASPRRGGPVATSARDEAATVAAPAQTSRDLELIRQRLLEPLLRRADAEPARELLGTLKPDGSWPDVDYKDTSAAGWKPFAHLSRLSLLARAYKSPRSSLRGTAELRKAVFAGLDFWLEHDFQSSNWWWNQIGTPRSLCRILLLLDEELSNTERQQGLEILGRAKIGTEGENLVWLTENVAIRGILERNPELVVTAYRRIADEIRVVPGNGIQADYSYLFHGPLLYSHGYGGAFISDCSRIANEVAGTGLAFPPDKIQLLNRLILDGTQWMTRGSATDFGAEGREITRRGQDARYLAEVAADMLRLPTGREKEFEALAARALDKPAPPLEGNRHFWRADLMAHHRRDWYASARMFSKRTLNSEEVNSEGLKSHHLADGCNIVMRTGREYETVFPAWDWQKIPGTTAEQTAALTGPVRRRGSRSFVGGVSDGAYGLSAFDFERDGLAARKSWFFFDTEFVSLGAGITCRSGNAIATTLNQSRLAGDVTSSEGGNIRTASRGTDELANPAWIYHDQTAYVFLQPTRVRLFSGAQKGNWWELNHQYSKAEVAVDVFKPWIDHGAGPTSATYAYLVAPGMMRERLGDYAAHPPVTILRNTQQLQAVRHDGLQIVGIAFYAPSRLELHKSLTVSVDKPCLVLLRERPEKLALTVANPENQASSVLVGVSGKWTGNNVRVLEGRDESQVKVELPGGLDAGKSVTCSLVRP